VGPYPVGRKPSTHPSPEATQRAAIDGMGEGLRELELELELDRTLVVASASGTASGTAGGSAVDGEGARERWERPTGNGEYEQGTGTGNRLCCGADLPTGSNSATSSPTVIKATWDMQLDWDCRDRTRRGVKPCGY
jgi:hypothetical protein